MPSRTARRASFRGRAEVSPLLRPFQPELPEDEYQPTKYGLTKQPEKTDPVHIIFHEWNNISKDLSRKDIGWKEKWFYLFGPPGWSHDGSRQTSEQMRETESQTYGESALSPQNRSRF